MSVYRYIAQNNPQKANDLCMRRGLPDSRNNTSQIAEFLQAIVAEDGEDGLKNVLDIHPDKEVIIAMFVPISEEVVKVEEPKKLNVESYSKEPEFERVQIPYTIPSQTNFNANSNRMLNATGTQTNTYILIAALVVSVAILSMK